MSMTVAISVDDSKVTLLLNQLHEAVANIEQGLLESVDNILIPDLYDSSTNVWNIRTGLYSSSWYSQITGPSVVSVGNDARNPRDGYAYSQSLEWGWDGVESPGVLYPTVYSDLVILVGELLSWIQNQMG